MSPFKGVEYIRYGGVVYSVEDGKDCAGCEFSVYAGCKCPDDFPEKECDTGKVYKRSDIAKSNGLSIEWSGKPIERGEKCPVCGCTLWLNWNKTHPLQTGDSDYECSFCLSKYDVKSGDLVMVKKPREMPESSIAEMKKWNERGIK